MKTEAKAEVKTEAPPPAPAPAPVEVKAEAPAENVTVTVDVLRRELTHLQNVVYANDKDIVPKLREMMERVTGTPLLTRVDPAKYNDLFKAIKEFKK